MKKNLIIIEAQCRELAEIRRKLRHKLELKSRAQAALDAQYSPALRQLQDACDAVRAGILTQLANARHEFANPKTQVFFDIKVGFRKAQDMVTMPDEPVLVDRIEKLLPTQVGETVLDRSVKVIKQAFKKLPWETLQKLGCSRVSGADEAIVLAQDDMETQAKKSQGDATFIHRSSLNLHP